MPTLKEFGAFRIVMFFKDHNPPHVHVIVPSGERAIVAIRDGRVIASTLSPMILRRARAWIAGNRAALTTKWNELA